MQQQDSITTLLATSRTIAVVGLSPDSSRPSYIVARYLQAQGYRVVPVNPTCAGGAILGERCHATLGEAAAAVAATGSAIDIVDCFRRPEFMPELVECAIAAGARGIWMQVGVAHDAAALRARKAGLQVVEDSCIKIEHESRGIVPDGGPPHTAARSD